MGYHVEGSDINPEMIEHAKANIDWLKLTYQIDEKQTVSVYEHDATEPLPSTEKKTIIATEGYLGPPLHTYPTPEVARKNLAEITEIYIAFFKNLATSSVLCLNNESSSSRTKA